MKVDFEGYYEDQPCPNCGSTDIEFIDADGIVDYDEEGEITGDYDWIDYKCKKCG